MVSQTEPICRSGPSQLAGMPQSVAVCTMADETTGSTRAELQEAKLALMEQRILTELRGINVKLDGITAEQDDQCARLTALEARTTANELAFIELKTRTKVMLGIAGLGGGGAGAGVLAFVQHLIGGAT